MNEEKKLEIHRLIREIDKALDILKPMTGYIVHDLHKHELMERRISLVGFLSQLIEDEADAFVTKEIQGDQQ
jgi:hypothetical protein